MKLCCDALACCVGRRQWLLLVLLVLHRIDWRRQQDLRCWCCIFPIQHFPYFFLPFQKGKLASSLVLLHVAKTCVLLGCDWITVVKSRACIYFLHAFQKCHLPTHSLPFFRERSCQRLRNKAKTKRRQKETKSSKNSNTIITFAYTVHQTIRLNAYTCRCSIDFLKL